MTVEELIEILNKYPPDMEIWVSDNGNSEGGVELSKVEKIGAYDAGLDGDDINDEYVYVEKNTDINKYLSKGYFLSNDGKVLYKEIILLNNHYYG